MKDKSGKQISTKEFIQRWGEGIKQITPYQQTKISLFGSWFIVIGVIFGLILSILNHTWWLVLILFGSFFVTGVSLLGTWQKYKALKKIDDAIKLMGGLNDGT